MFLCYYFFKVYKLSIGAACGLKWPSHKLIVQVLDDSTNEVLRVNIKSNEISTKLHFANSK